MTLFLAMVLLAIAVLACLPISLYLLAMLIDMADCSLKYLKEGDGVGAVLCFVVIAVVLLSAIGMGWGVYSLVSKVFFY